MNNLDKILMEEGLEAEMRETIRRVVIDAPISAMDLKYFLGTLRGWVNLGHSLAEITGLMLLKDPRLVDEIE